MKKNLLLLGLSLLPMIFNAQKLDKAKTNLKKDLVYEVSYSEAGSEKEEEQTSFKNDLAYDLIVKPIVFIAGYLTYGLFVESGMEGKHSHMELTPYPYLNNLKGDYAFEANEVAFTRFDISNQFLTDQSNTYGNNLNVKFRFLERASVEYNQLYLLESKKYTSQFFIHDLTANYYRIRTNHLSLHYGLGVSYAHSGVNKAYFTYNTGISYFMNVPLSISLEHRGTPFSENGIYQTNLNFNYHIRNYAIQAGFNFYNIGNVHYKMFGLGGKIYL
ncbi:hypothetical protein QVZ41_03355 [Wenyingzhuangia sp. chi5]|uniref:Outer membrane protein beta-barrel domain-containing protein n=1 Tax=Wenyingzhuangia gilva TaxID=3057677 RepID=A0ABT8VPI2_9FLAO|nr:hypothetical protein [Wenyingzhuangia sp. chi5]MDO3693885.1 hypothetical protein [Wenyingzhuangia sp. chi5]